MTVSKVRFGTQDAHSDLVEKISDETAKNDFKMMESFTPAQDTALLKEIDHFYMSKSEKIPLDKIKPDMFDVS